jgi:hypothetical protein
MKKTNDSKLSHGSPRFRNVDISTMDMREIEKIILDILKSKRVRSYGKKQKYERIKKKSRKYSRRKLLYRVKPNNYNEKRVDEKSEKEVIREAVVEDSSRSSYDYEDNVLVNIEDSSLLQDNNSSDDISEDLRKDLMCKAYKEIKSEQIEAPIIYINDINQFILNLLLNPITNNNNILPLLQDMFPGTYEKHGLFPYVYMLNQTKHIPDNINPYFTNIINNSEII